MKHRKPIKGQIRQGDILINPVLGLAIGKAPKPRECGRVVLAHGEVTGHSHDVADPEVVTLYDDVSEFTGTAILDVTAPTTVVHQEHSAGPLTAGRSEVRRAEEWTDDDEPRQVED